MIARPNSEGTPASLSATGAPEQLTLLPLPPLCPTHMRERLTPRQRRVLAAMVDSPGIMRETLDAIAGASNGPELVRGLRAMGLAIKCDRVARVDRDGRTCRPGIYYFADGRSRLFARRLLEGEVPHG